MPNVVIDFLEGRTIEQKREMVKRVTAAIAETLNCKPEAVQIIIHELSKDQWANGGQLRCDND
ncbi:MULTISPECIES: 4-oxalocrotonate tautomerase [unclassified Gilliamella]|uniref:4-oxalocrotonate tautomerase n=1 Tax=unclassified Gilliamella TaxID=2685620 RepID=UPI001C695099|nr:MULTISPECIES: 4-oxalocrotonate tautomerase [unclassified Gilliamella]MCX8600663.1 4-oxalocrotonate tautomerase [Gilliamella sp. B3722]MCX8609203.1 4-oxalocrotonate tautomerase [Gilliamella sp. B3771]MCX8609880.1 4-oxalocrotonate tautomerase [Gilliamella sp. B3891]MCX8612030.1 4-oxalocrotonate tautomerase [Gilliamella sp. B3773]MCX8615534.1 4-oxalocrotonate tautomerase [Gilliamella sp. B3770]